MVSWRRVPRGPSPLGTEDGIRAAYDSHGAELYRYAWRALGDAQAAQDVVQETFVRAWRSEHLYDPARASQRVWLFAIARNAVVDHYRSARARPWQRALVDAETIERVGGFADDANDELLRGWTVREALEQLTAEQRFAIVETYLVGRSYADVAAAAGVPVSTLRSRVFYGLKALRVVMDEMEVHP